MVCCQTWNRRFRHETHWCGGPCWWRRPLTARPWRERQPPAPTPSCWTWRVDPLHIAATRRGACSASALQALAQSGGETLLWTDAVGVAEDLAACPPGAIAGVLVTAGSREELDAVDGALGDWESRHGMQRGVVNVEVVLATAAAVQCCATIAAGSSRVVALALDEQALLRAVGANGGARRDLAAYYRGAVVVAARALGVQAHGAVGQGVGALAAGYAAVGRRMGLRGALCFDADVVALVNSGFSPREGEVEAARRVLAAMDAAIADGRGAIAASAGTMADLANVRQARAVIDRADAIERRLEPPMVDEDTPEPGPTSEEGSAPPWR